MRSDEAFINDSLFLAFFSLSSDIPFQRNHGVIVLDDELLLDFDTE